MTPRFSLVVPFFNEAGNIQPLLEAAVPVLDQLDDDCEVLLINDGSTDGTAAELVTAAARWPQCRAVQHAENRGQATRLLEGLQAARGEFILTMDGDGQNDPRDFPALLALVMSGTLDVACGWRVARSDPVLRRMMSGVANVVRRAVLRDGVHDAGCQLRVMRRGVVTALFPTELLQSFLPAIAVAAGFRVGELPVRHHARLHGQPKYGLRRLWWRPMVTMFRLRRRLTR